MVFRFVPEIIFKVQDFLKAKGPHAVRQLTIEFAKADPEFSGVLPADTWLECLDAAGVFVTTKELERLTKEFEFKYPDFLHLLSNRTLESPARQELVGQLFEELKDDSGCVAAGAILARFDAAAHPDVRFHGKSEADAVLHWSLAFQDLPDPMDRDAYMEAWRCIAGSFTNGSDAEFLEVMKQCFGVAIPPAGPGDARFIDRVENVLRAKILHKVRPHKTERETFLKSFKYVDPKDLGHISVEQFQAFLERFGLWLPLDECDAIFSRYAEDVDGQPRLRYAPFVRQFLDPDMPHFLNHPMDDNYVSSKLDFGTVLN